MRQVLYRRIITVAIGLLLYAPNADSILFPIYLGIGHNNVEKKFIEIQKKLSERLDLKAAAFSTASAASITLMNQITDLRKREYKSLTTAYAYYTDSTRIKQFKNDVDTVKQFIKDARVVIDKNKYARGYFGARIEELLGEVENAETLFSEATEKQGFDAQRDNAERNMLLLESEELLKNIYMETVKLVRIGKTLHLDRQLMEQWGGESYKKKRE